MEWHKVQEFPSVVTHSSCGRLNSVTNASFFAKGDTCITEVCQMGGTPMLLTTW